MTETAAKVSTRQTIICPHDGAVHITVSVSETGQQDLVRCPELEEVVRQRQRTIPRCSLLKSGGGEGACPFHHISRCIP